MGGDGILFEVVNGMMERVDWETAFRQVKLGIIPCGSGNGLAKAISHQFRLDVNIIRILTQNSAWCKLQITLVNV